MSKAFAISIVCTLREHSHRAYLVGGCVRDLVLGREPADYDVTTDATPEEVMRIFPETYAVGAQFGVVLVPVPEAIRRDEARPVFAEDPAVRAGTNRDAPSRVSPETEYVPTDHSRTGVVEVATFRSDVGYSDGRH